MFENGILKLKFPLALYDFYFYPQFLRYNLFKSRKIVHFPLIQCLNLKDDKKIIDFISFEEYTTECCYIGVTADLFFVGLYFSPRFSYLTSQLTLVVPNVHIVFITESCNIGYFLKR